MSSRKRTGSQEGTATGSNQLRDNPEKPSHEGDEDCHLDADDPQEQFDYPFVESVETQVELVDAPVELLKR